jgi:phenylalanyl-tRNA synthetase beta chain
MMKLAVPRQYDGNAIIEKSYQLKPSDDPTFFPGRSADVLFNNQKIGVMGVVHPQVLGHYGITFPCAALEICIEPFV